MAVETTTSALRDMIYAASFAVLADHAGLDARGKQQARWRVAGHAGPDRLGQVLAARPFTVPINAADQAAAGHWVDDFQQWLRHDRPDDPYWRDRVFTDTLAEVRVPVSTLGGWHDFMLPWQLRDYARLRAAGQQPQLTIGPWGHADDASIKGWLADLLPFLGHHLRGDPAPREQPVHLYVTGAEQWRDLPDWPPAQPASRWYLQPGQRLSTTAPAPAGSSGPAPLRPGRPDPLGRRPGRRGQGDPALQRRAGAAGGRAGLHPANRWRQPSR